MIDIIQMPEESRKIAPVLDSIELRRASYQSKASWIGQSENQLGGLEECDRSECYHIVNHDGRRSIGYARLKPLNGEDCGDGVSQRIVELAQQSRRLPAYLLQKVSVRELSEDDPMSFNQINILRELAIAALRIANFNQCRFIYTSCDRGGTAILRKTGVRYSTLSTPFLVDGRQTVILCIPVTNKNIMALNPLKLVWGTAAGEKPVATNSSQRLIVEAPSIFDKMDALAELDEFNDL